MVNRVMLWAFVAVIALVFLGVAFTLSQGTSGTQFSAGGVPNPGHASEDIYCNGCVKSLSISDGEITDQDISIGAGINPQKVKGVNGYFSAVTILNANAFLDLPQSQLWGISDWASKRVETICGPGISGEIASLDGTIDFASSGTQYLRAFNHYTVSIPLAGAGNTFPSVGNGWVQVYQEDTKQVSNAVSIGSRNLYMRVSPTDSAKLQITQTLTGVGYSTTGAWRCFVKFVG